jgi:hypothetical protein
VAGRALLGDAPQGGKLQFVPKGCTLASVQVEAHYAFKYAVFGPRVIRGTVKLSNGNTFAVPISKVSVTLAPAVPVSPFIITASCSGGSVPSSPQPYQYGGSLVEFCATACVGDVRPAARLAGSCDALAYILVCLDDFVINVPPVARMHKLALIADPTSTTPPPHPLPRRHPDLHL